MQRRGSKDNTCLDPSLSVKCTSDISKLIYVMREHRLRSIHVPCPIFNAVYFIVCLYLVRLYIGSVGLGMSNSVLVLYTGPLQSNEIDTRVQITSV